MLTHIIHNPFSPGTKVLPPWVFLFCCLKGGQPLFLTHLLLCILAAHAIVHQQHH